MFAQVKDDDRALSLGSLTIPLMRLLASPELTMDQWFQLENSGSASRIYIKTVLRVRISHIDSLTNARHRSRQVIRGIMPPFWPCWRFSEKDLEFLPPSAGRLWPQAHALVLDSWVLLPNQDLSFKFYAICYEIRSCRTWNSERSENVKRRKKCNNVK